LKKTLFWVTFSREALLFYGYIFDEAIRIIDRENKTIYYTLSETELENRKSKWKRLEKKVTSKLLEKYREEWTNHDEKTIAELEK